MCFELALQLDQFSVLLSIFLVPVSLLSTLLLTSVSLLSILLKPVSKVCRLIPVSKVCIRFNCLRRPGGAGLQVRCHHFINCQVKSQSIELEREISTRLGTKMMKMKTPLSRFRMFAIVATTRANLWSYQFIFNLYNFVINWWSVIISGSNESVRRIVLPGQAETLQDCSNGLKAPSETKDCKDLDVEELQIRKSQQLMVNRWSWGHHETIH